MIIPVKFKKLDPNAATPTYGSVGASGADLYALNAVIINPNQTKMVSTGVAFEIPEGFEIQIRPRSGLSLRTGLRIPNSPATIDQDYTGECCVLIENTGSEPYHIKQFDRIAQAVLCPVVQMLLYESSDLQSTDRGDAGFGSTGA